MKRKYLIPLGAAAMVLAASTSAMAATTGAAGGAGPLGAFVSILTTYGNYIGYIALIIAFLAALFRHQLEDILGPIIWRVVAVALLLGIGSIWTSMGGTAVSTGAVLR